MNQPWAPIPPPAHTVNLNPELRQKLRAAAYHTMYGNRRIDGTRHQPTPDEVVDALMSIVIRNPDLMVGAYVPTETVLTELHEELGEDGWGRVIAVPTTAEVDRG